MPPKDNTSPLPWKADGYAIQSEDGPIGRCYDGVGVTRAFANGELIAYSVNRTPAVEALVEAAESFLEVSAGGKDGYLEARERILAALSALKEAK